jgi:hypothetical protein
MALSHERFGGASYRFVERLKIDAGCRYIFVTQDGLYRWQRRIPISRDCCGKVTYAMEGEWLSPACLHNPLKYLGYCF